MGRPKGGKNNKYSYEDKWRIVQRYFHEGYGIESLAQEENIPTSTLRGWIIKYLNHGEEGLIASKPKGNQFAALHTSKSLSEEDRLRLIIAKQEIEIERLKKGYQVKGVGAEKVFVTSKGRNSKS